MIGIVTIISAKVPVFLILALAARYCYNVLGNLMLGADNVLLFAQEGIDSVMLQSGIADKLL